MNTPLSRLRLIGFIEGVSYLVLLGIAMPLKYFADYPLAVKYTGWVHGVLFVAFGVALLNVWISRKWPFLKVVKAFIASLLPFGTFILDKSLKAEEASIQR
jgi:integral membrane protein